MENAEEVFQFLEEFSKRKPKTIPQELNDYLMYVARTGDPVYQWSLVKTLFKEKLLNVITDFHESTPSVDIPPCPNVDPFNYDIMKNSLIERLDTFTSAPFTVQRICELLTCPRKQYNRVDKFMRAIEKNILVVSTREPGIQRHHEPENGEPMEGIVNGSDNNSEYNVDVEMEDMTWKESGESRQEQEPQPGSSEAHISVDDLEARLHAKQEEPSQDKQTTHYESVTPPELNTIDTVEDVQDQKPTEESVQDVPVSDKNNIDTGARLELEPSTENVVKTEVENEADQKNLVIPDIKIDDADTTEQNLQKQQIADKSEMENKTEVEPTFTPDNDKSADESSSDTSIKEDSEPKNISEASSSSEESSSSGDNIDGNSNSPKQQEEEKQLPPENKECGDSPNNQSTTPETKIQPENYSITDVNSELPQPIPLNTDESQKTNQSEEIEPKKEEVLDVPTNSETASS